MHAELADAVPRCGSHYALSAHRTRTSAAGKSVRVSRRSARARTAVLARRPLASREGRARRSPPRARLSCRRS